MTDAPDIQQPKPLDTIKEIPRFDRSKKGGYVEEIVDEYVKGTVADTNRLINAYNTLRDQHYATVLELNAANDRVDELESREAPSVETVEQFVEVTPEGEINEFEATPTTANVSIDELEADAAERSAELFREAQGVARRFVEDAKTKATTIVDEAETHATQVTETARLEAETIKNELDLEVAGLVKDRDTLVTESDAIVDRIKRFHASQLEAIEANYGERTVGYSPVPATDAE